MLTCALGMLTYFWRRGWFRWPVEHHRCSRPAPSMASRWRCHLMSRWRSQFT